jgi:hypothetical protein
MLKKSWSRAHHTYFASGVDAVTIGEWFDEGECLGYLVIDFSKFDATQGERWFHIEHELYKRSGFPKHVLGLLRDKITTRGKTSFGVDYSIEGTRESGDPTTTVGNSSYDGLVIKYGLSKQGFSLAESRAIVMGDDNLSKCQKVVDIDALIEVLKPSGLVPKAEFITNPNLVEFCSSRFWPTSRGHRVLAPKMGRQLAKCGWFIRPSKRLSPLRGSAISMNRDCQFVPLLRVVFEKIIELTAGDKVVKSVTDHNFHVPTAAEDILMTDETYQMCEDLYGLGKTQIQELETLISGVSKLPVMLTHNWLEAIFEKDCE